MTTQSAATRSIVGGKTEYVLLSSVARIVSGGTPRTGDASFWNGTIPWVTPKDLSGLGSVKIHSTPRSITEAGLRNSSAELLPENSVLFSSRAPIGLLAINTIPMATNQGFKSFVPDPKRLDSRYLFRWLEANRTELQNMGVGATFKEVSKAIVSRLVIPLPPLDEQRRIADILDKADELRIRRRQSIAHLDALPQAILHSMFGSPKVEREKIGNLAKFKSGKFLPASSMIHTGNYSVYGGNGVNGQHDQFMFADRKLVIGRVGAYCGVVHLTAPNSWITDNALYADSITPKISLNYFVAALKAANLNRYSSQSGQPLISGSRINQVEIALPSLEEQEIFSDRVLGIETLKNQLQAQLDTFEMLFLSLQQRAYKGKL